jgi:hypothetical protein
MLIETTTVSIIAITASALGLFSFLCAIIALIKIRNLNKKIAIMLSGKGAADLESIILSHSQSITDLDKEIQELFEISNKIHKLASESIHKVDVLRFNPFKDIGGDQSFAIALLNGKNSGLVMSSLHTREGTRIYAKPVTKGTSEKYTLTEEEKLAIKNATASKNLTV